jgi:1-acyl-sn-glycerol-3-phosphate acyltransferase
MTEKTRTLTEKSWEAQSKKYKAFIARVYLKALPLILTNAFPFLLKGIYYGIRGKKADRIQAFLDGSRTWGLWAQKITKSDVRAFNEIPIPKSGHLVFSNHVNEMDFPFDCVYITKPYLANQVIKKTLFAYWWMKAMGSEVFDNRNTMSISISVKNLLRGIKENCYIVYPEGRNTYSEEIQPLKKGMLKLAFDHKLPIVIVLKSGIASYQDFQKGNKIGYKYYGVVRPDEFSDWESLRDHVQKVMEEGKKDLDQLIS